MHFDSKKYSFQVISSNSILKEREWVKQNYMYFENKNCIITISLCSEYASRNKFWMFSKTNVYSFLTWAILEKFDRFIFNSGSISYQILNINKPQSRTSV